ncbi:predicted protein [Aspergillus terreus NIH2624]|uniref:Uncharacterized protein n=1 Tax=Aspergillus terreus (strain NIH 2624 / FGSC A1156) TaxID=341663 RepID=Q0CN37_ASPTN|nr:uncharacterized protein ATEG_04897 [Aspergillus terreus NIH2624]EAU35344.1 predicted protein [Aspergillus terreus NIH2624]
MGSTINETVCENQKYRTIISKWPSIVSITERGTYDGGANPVNLFLSYYPDGYNLSSLPYGDQIIYGHTKLHWSIVSSRPTWSGSVLSDGAVEINDYLTATKPSSSLFALNATLQGSLSGSFDNITMPACNTTTETDYWHVQLSTSDWWGWRGFEDVTYPELLVEFDDQTANLTLEGYYRAAPYLQEEFEIAQRPTTGRNDLFGWVQVRFNGVLDAYHSDVLDVKASSPEWLRTVGFGNNSANVGYENGSPSVIPWLKGVGVVSLLTAMIV